MGPIKELFATPDLSSDITESPSTFFTTSPESTKQPFYSPEIALYPSTIDPGLGFKDAVDGRSIPLSTLPESFGRAAFAATDAENKPFLHPEYAHAIHDPRPRGQTQWEPGRWYGLPWVSGIALSLAFLFTIFMFVLPLRSHNMRMDYWLQDIAFQPSVLLSIASTTANTMLSFALGQGAVISWWRKSMRGSVSLRELHKQWSSNSLPHAIAAMFTFGQNRVVIACLAVAAAQLNGPLLQRASSTGSVNRTELQSIVMGRWVLELPFPYTDANGDFVHSPGLSNLLNDFTIGNSLQMSNVGFSDYCGGQCIANIDAAGWHANCATSYGLYDLKVRDSQNTSQQTVKLFEVSIEIEDHQLNTTLKINSIYKNGSDCSGNVVLKTCLLTLATMTYPVVVNSNNISLSTDTFVKNATIDSSNSEAAGDLLSIFADYLNVTYSTSTQLVVNPNDSGGPILSSRFRTPGIDTSTRPLSQRIKLTTAATDAMPDMLEAVRDLLFRTAYEIYSFQAESDTNGSYPLEPQSDPTNVTVTKAFNVYQSDLRYYLPAVLLTFFAIFCVLCTFRGCSTLGRTASLSPIDIARAFDAPLVRSHDGNAEIEELLDDIGSTKVQYGAVFVVDGHEVGDVARTNSERGKGVTRLKMASPLVVQRPRAGATFS
ncbi:MAG: hypothetical protein M1820_003209 [Bogoriella megaspora]|nr:MAG: hypothetical protein M1820_003209 [Bogoriella megaspora]